MKRAVIYAVVALVLVAVVGVAIRGQVVPVEAIKPIRLDVREYIAEDAKTRLDKRYVVDMPVTGTLERIQLDVGDEVEKGDVVARVDAFDLDKDIVQVKALIAQERARVVGVDVAKPKDVDIESAKLRIQEMMDALEIARNVGEMTKVHFDEAERTYERAKGLIEAGATSQAFHDEAEMMYRSLKEDLKRTEIEESGASKALEQAKIAHKRLVDSIDDNEYERALHLAEIQRLEAQLSQLKNDLKKTKICAPVSGPVLEKYIEDSRVLIAGTELVEIGDMASIEIESDVLSEEVGRVEIGNPVELRGKALEGEVAMGRVKRIYPSGFEKISALGVEQQRVKVLIEFDNASLGLRPGTSIDVRIVTDESPDALAVPDRAVFRHNGGWAVFVARGGRAHIQAVEIGLRNDEWVEIRGGLELNDQVISELSNTLSDRLKVKLESTGE